MIIARYGHGAPDTRPLRVALPLGIGDCHWACQKLRGLSAYHGGRPIHAHVNVSPNHVSVNYLKLLPFVAEAHQDKRAPYSITTEMPPFHWHERWSTLDGCAQWNGFDYILVANGHLEQGKRIEEWLPEIETDYTYPLAIPQADQDYAATLCRADQILVYPSGTGPNYGFHRHRWRVGDWVDILRLLNEAGHVPVLVGANTPDDCGYRDQILELARKNAPDLAVVDTVGLTRTGQVMAMIQRARGWVGFNSGLGIVSAMLGTPTVMLWSDHRYPIAPVTLHANMQRSWLHESQLATYRTLSFGSPDLTPANVVAACLEVCG